MTITSIVALIGEGVALVGALLPIFQRIRKLTEGTKCQLRSEMLRTYYHNREAQKIRQYEYENFLLLYDAYKALKGNSFIDKIYEEVKSWDIIT